MKLRRKVTQVTRKMTSPTKVAARASGFPSRQAKPSRQKAKLMPLARLRNSSRLNMAQFREASYQFNERRLWGLLEARWRWRCQGIIIIIQDSRLVFSQK